MDSAGLGLAENKMENGVYIRAFADSINADRLVDINQQWEADRWRFYYLRYSPELPPVKIRSNDATTIYADFREASPGEYTIYMKWEYVPPTPLNIACYDPHAMNEVYNNTFVALTEYRETRHGGYGDSGRWASPLMFVGMTRGSSDPGEYSIYVHGNQFMSNDLFLNSYEDVNMTVRIENNTFTLLNQPHITSRESRIRNAGKGLENGVIANNSFIR